MMDQQSASLIGEGLPLCIPLPPGERPLCLPLPPGEGRGEGCGTSREPIQRPEFGPFVLQYPSPPAPLPEGEGRQTENLTLRRHRSKKILWRNRIALSLLLVVPFGCTPAAPPSVIAMPKAPVVPPPFDMSTLPDVRYVEITQEAGLSFRHTNAAKGEKLLPETMGSGAAFLDYDGDGDPDIFLVNSTTWPDAVANPVATHALYRNEGQGHFENVTSSAGLDKTSFGMGVAVGDYDNDGDPDLYVTALGGNSLYRNDGQGHFADVTAEANARGGNGWFTSATFFDLDNDGDLDLFACCYVAWSPEIDRGISTQLLGTGKGNAYDPPAAYNGTHCLLLRNDGGKFVDISESSGIQVRSVERQVPVAKALGVAPYDVDGDGRVDLAVANDTVANFFFHNLGGGRFEEIGLPIGIAYDTFGSTRAAMGIDWADFKNDGTIGLAIGNFANEMTALYVTENPKTLLFSDLANIYGLGAATQPPLKFGLFFFDYDLDGRLDLLMANGHLESDIAKTQATESYAQSAQLFWNTGKPGRELFVLVGASKVGPDLLRPIVGRGSTFADIDNDGDLDVLLTANGGPAHLFRNDGGNKNHSIRLNLQGTTSNRDALGAQITVTSGGIVSRRQLFLTKGYLSSVEHPLTFGLGRQQKADRVTILWPSGATTELKDLAAGSHKIIEPTTPKLAGEGF